MSLAPWACVCVGSAKRGLEIRLFRVHRCPAASRSAGTRLLSRLLSMSRVRFRWGGPALFPAGSNSARAGSCSSLRASFGIVYERPCVRAKRRRLARNSAICTILPDLRSIAIGTSRFRLSAEELILQHVERGQSSNSRSFTVRHRF